MTTPPRKHRILVTNDDGFDAPGLAALIEVADEFAQDIWVVAPHIDQSGKGQSFTLNSPLRCHPRGAQQWSVDGTPADCVIWALSHLMKDAKPDLILSGVNAGQNVGDDLNVSGTVGAALMSLMLGTPSIAISLKCASRKAARWDTARAVLPNILENFLREGWDKNHCLSINIPDVPISDVKGIAWTHCARKTMPSFEVVAREDLRENEYFWIHPTDDESHADSGSDVAALNRGHVSITALTLDRAVTVMAAPFGKKTANDE